MCSTRWLSRFSVFTNIALHVIFLSVYIDNGVSVHSGVPFKREWEENQDSTSSDTINSPSESNDSNLEEEQDQPKPPCQSMYVKLALLTALNYGIRFCYIENHVLVNYNYDIQCNNHDITTTTKKKKSEL